LIIYGLALPLAIFLGYLLATPLDYTTLTVVAIVLSFLTIPLFLRWHHPWLLAVWNTSAVLFFLPGRPPVWSAVAIISFSIGVLQYIINRDVKFLNVPSVTRPILFLGVVVLITMRLTGGVGLKAFGSATNGGKNYLLIFAAIVGYFAIISHQIPPKRAGRYVLLYFIGSITLAIGDLPILLPSGFNFLYLVFPLLQTGALAQQGIDVTGMAGGVLRVTGFGFVGMALFGVMLARYGLRGIFMEPGKPWRAIVFAAVLFSGLLGGYRSVFILFLMVLAVLFYLERLHHTQLLPVLIISTILGGTLMAAFANRLPFGVQRSIAFLPLNIDPVARMSATSTTEWRLQMWKEILPQVPQYLLLGKGYSFSASELAMIQDDTHRNASGLESTMLAGDYHNGGLSVIIPFGLPGMLGFLWFLWAGIRVTYQNYQFGDPNYLRINTFVFALFLVKAIFFFTIFGGLVSDFMQFTGLVGLSISLNGGVAKPAVATQPQVSFNRFRLHPSVRRAGA
jgi:hypothetical protein